MNLGADVTRIWEFRRSDEEIDPAKIVLRYNPVTKVHSLLVNGIDQLEASGESKLSAKPNQPLKLEFVIPRSQPEVRGSVFVESGGRAGGLLSSFGGAVSPVGKYKCVVASKDMGQIELKESNELFNDPDQSVENVDVHIPQVVVDGNEVVWYKTEAYIERSYKSARRELRFSVHRRFRDFRFTYSQILSAYRGSHLLGSIPKHPPKHMKLLEDHLSKDFIEKRRQDLETWLRKVLYVPRAAINPDVEAFLGMGDPSMREISVVMQEGESLGLRLKKRDSFPQAAVIGFERTADDKPGIAESSGMVRIGHVISKIGGESMIRAQYEEIIPRIAHMRRPLIVHFIGRIESGANEISSKLGSDMKFMEKGGGDENEKDENEEEGDIKDSLRESISSEAGTFEGGDETVKQELPVLDANEDEIEQVQEQDEDQKPPIENKSDPFASSHLRELETHEELLAASMQTEEDDSSSKKQETRKGEQEEMYNDDDLQDVNF